MVQWPGQVAMPWTDVCGKVFSDLGTSAILSTPWQWPKLAQSIKNQMFAINLSNSHASRDNFDAG